jgi:glycine/D-amino acid oxidase-like deaminating enzyme
MDETHDVVVIGGGLAGLAAAATAAGAGASVLVVDAQAAGRGGRAATDQVGRFRFNRGAHALYNKGAGRAVLDRLGVPVVGHAPPLKGALGRLGDRVGLLPLNVRSLARTDLLGLREKVVAGRLLGSTGRWRPEELSGVTAEQWLDGLEVDGTVRRLAEMLIRLTSYAADLDGVSADLVTSQIQAAGGGVEYLDRGWVTLVDGLAGVARRRGARMDGHRSVRRVEPDGGRVRVHLDGDGSGPVLARRVVIATGTPQAGRVLLPETPAGWGALGPPARAACLDVGLATVPATAVLLGVDRPLYLIRHAPPGELAPAGGAVMHGLLYLRHDQDPSPSEARAVLAEHCRVAGFDPDEAEESRYLHRMVTCGALPTPAGGGMAGRPGVDTGLEGVLVAGDWVGPQGHLADAALASGESAGRTAAAGIDRDDRDAVRRLPA